MADDKSAYLRAQPEKIPSELRSLAYWCNWRWPDKAPTPAIGHTPLSFAQAIAVDDEHLGFHFLAEHPYCMVDLDEDTPHARATLKAARECGAYVERSVRRKWHIYGVGRLDRSITPGQVPGVEVYSHGRFGIVTGVEGTGSVEVSVQHILDRLDRLRASERPQERPGGSTWNPDVHEPLLARIDADSAYGPWFEVSAACYHMGCPFETWLAWCRTGRTKFPGERELRAKWPKLATEREQVYGEGTLRHYAGLRSVQPDEWDDVGEAGFCLGDLVTAQHRPHSWFVRGIACEGLTVFGGSPKTGKTWTLYQLLLADHFLGRGITPRPTLALMLEDSPARTSERLGTFRELLGTSVDEQAAHTRNRVEVHYDWPHGDEGLARIDAWLAQQREDAVVFIDTFAAFLGLGEDHRKHGVYRTEYHEAKRVARVAAARHACIIATHHLRKATDADPVMQLSGSTGLPAAADTLWVLKCDRLESTGYFMSTGRDIADELNCAIVRKRPSPLWEVDREVEEWPRSPRERAALEVLRLQGEPMSVAEVAEALADELAEVADARRSATTLLARLVDKKWARRVERGRYEAVPLEGDAEWDDIE